MAFAEHTRNSAVELDITRCCEGRKYRGTGPTSEIHMKKWWGRKIPWVGVRAPKDPPCFPGSGRAVNGCGNKHFKANCKGKICPPLVFPCSAGLLQLEFPPEQCPGSGWDLDLQQWWERKSVVVASAVFKEVPLKGSLQGKLSAKKCCSF